MALIDIYTIRDGVRFRAPSNEDAVKKKFVWKCGVCNRGSVAEATDWEDIEIKRKCPVCKRKVVYGILGQ